MSGWLYALECVIVPCAIGLAMYALFDAWDQRRRANRDDELPHIDYHI
jgi:hypothetical protein